MQRSHSVKLDGFVKSRFAIEIEQLKFLRLSSYNIFYVSAM